MSVCVEHLIAVPKIALVAVVPWCDKTVCVESLRHHSRDQQYNKSPHGRLLHHEHVQVQDHQNVYEEEESGLRDRHVNASVRFFPTRTCILARGSHRSRLPQLQRVSTRRSLSCCFRVRKRHQVWIANVYEQSDHRRHPRNHSQSELRIRITSLVGVRGGISSVRGDDPADHWRRRGFPVQAEAGAADLPHSARPHRGL